MKKQNSETLKYALMLITKKDRTEAELRNRLHRKGFSDTEIDEVVKYLKQNGFIDDTKFIQKAEKLAEDRFLGTMGLKNYLVRKGIDKELIESIPQIDELAIAKKLIQRKLHLIKNDSFNKKKAKIAGYLLRRGFSWETVNKCINDSLGDIESPEDKIFRED